MDTSKEYIEMCQKATEIQELCPFQEGDFILNTSTISPPEGHLFVNYKFQPYPDKRGSLFSKFRNNVISNKKLSEFVYSS